MHHKRRAAGGTGRQSLSGWHYQQQLRKVTGLVLGTLDRIGGEQPTDSPSQACLIDSQAHPLRCPVASGQFFFGRG